MTDDTTHPTAEDLSAHAVGGGTPNSRAAIEHHAAGCPACAAHLLTETTMDATMTAALAAARPTAGFEDRLVGAVRSAATAVRRRPPKLPPRVVRRAAVAAAAAGVVVGFGVLGSQHLRGFGPGAADDARRAADVGPTDAAFVIPQAYDDEDAGLVALLDRRMAEVRFTANGLNDVIEFFRDTMGANIYVDWKALEAANIQKDTPVTARLHNIRFSKALDVVFSAVQGTDDAHRLGYVVDGGVITISTRKVLNERPRSDPVATVFRNLLPKPGQPVMSQGQFTTSAVVSADGEYVPYSDILHYPASWPTLSEQRDSEVRSERGEAAGVPLSVVGPAARYDNTDSVLLPTDDPIGKTGGRAPNAAADVPAGLTTPPAVAAPPVPIKPQAETDHFGPTGVTQNAVTNNSTFTNASGNVVNRPTTPPPPPPPPPPATPFAFRPGDTVVVDVPPPTKIGGQPTAPLGYFHGTAGTLALTAASDTTGASTTGSPTVYMGGHVASRGIGLAGDRITLKQAVMAPGMLDGLATPEHANGAVAAETANAQPAATQPAVDGRKVIRTGTMEFEVDRFDTAAATLAKVVGEAGGFVATTDSQKLPNGKTRGTVTVRVPPERLDLLVTALRALGDLKAQQITAQDVTKEYTDLESELTADRAMQARLLDLIQSGKGSIKDLLAAEEELGNWRTKVEKAEGAIRYYNSQIGLSTLAVTLAERDIQQAAAVVETETAEMGVEADDVERARDAAFKAIAAAKGRVVDAELKRLDAGQLSATVTAEVPPEGAGATIDQLKQLGRVARLEVHRQQTAANADAAGVAVRTDRRPTVIRLSIYNLANVAPRRTTAVTLAAADPEAAYAALLGTAKAGGRVVTSNLERGAAATGTVQLELPPSQLEAALAVAAAHGEVLKRASAENPDTQNTTDAKVGLTATLVSLAAVSPRESATETVAVGDVATAYRAIVAAGNAAGAHFRVSQLSEQDRTRVRATVEVDVPRAAVADFDKAVAAAGDVVGRSVNRQVDAENSADSVVRETIAVVPADDLPARRMVGLAVKVADADGAAAAARAAAVGAGGRVLEDKVGHAADGSATADVTVDVPLARAGQTVDEFRRLGAVRDVESETDATAPAGPSAHARVHVAISTADPLVADQNGLGAKVRDGLSVGLAGLLASVKVVVVGLSLVGPWAVVAWVGWRVWRRARRPRVAA